MIKMSKPTALHTIGTAQVSEWLNISDTAKKLYSGERNSRIAVVITTKLQTRGSKLKFICIRKVKTEEEKVKTHTQVQRSDSRDSAKVKRLRQIGAEMVQDSKVTT